MANQANLELTMAAIEAHPEHWDQSKWHCGTSHCFGGFAEMLRLEENPCEPCVLAGGENFLVDHTATREWLDLSPNQWSAITSGSNTIEDLRRMVKEGVPDEPDDEWDGRDDYDEADWDEDEDDEDY